MLTGRGGPAGPNGREYPFVGSIATALLAPQPGMPPMSRPIRSSIGLRPGYSERTNVGIQHNPFGPTATPTAANFQVEQQSRFRRICRSPAADRRVCRKRSIGCGATSTRAAQSPPSIVSIAGVRSGHRRGGPAGIRYQFRRPRLRDKYGRHNLGPEQLLARPAPYEAGSLWYRALRRWDLTGT